MVRYKNLDLYPMPLIQLELLKTFLILILVYKIIRDVNKKRNKLSIKYKNKVKKSVNGLEMLIFQAIKSIEIWTETTYNVDQKLDSIKQQLEKVIC